MSTIFEPTDSRNTKLRQDVFPPDWTNPQPSGKYNLVVIGAGTGGLVAAAGAAGLGAKVALIERRALGGDCLNVGCVPSKALIRSARAIAEARRVKEFGGVINGSIEVDFAVIMERMRRLRAEISPNDSAERFSKLGVDVFLGEGRFTGPDEVEVDGQRLQFSRAVIATGGRPILLPVEGLSDANPLTNESLFSLTELPRRLAVVGAGPIGCEMAQAFARFGSKVTVIEMGSRLLGKEDTDSAGIVEAAMKRDGVDFLYDAKLSKVEPCNGGYKLSYTVQGKTHSLEVDRILLGAGRAPNVEGLGLEQAGVEAGKTGVQVDDRLQTTNKRISAVGDVAMKYKFTHAADAAARVVIQNALFMGRKKISDEVIPWCTYTDPEIAHVGLYESEAREACFEVEVLTQEMSSVDRAILDGEEQGLLKVYLKKGSDTLLGATLVGAHAGEILPELTLSLTAKVGLGKIGKTIHTYPTQAEIIKKAADAHARRRLTPKVAGILKAWLKFRR